MGEGPDEIERRIEQQRRDAEPKVQDLKRRVRQARSDLSTARHETTYRIRQASANSAAVARGTRSAVSGVFNMDTRNALLARLAIGFAVGFASRLILPEPRDEPTALSEGRSRTSISP